MCLRWWSHFDARGGGAPGGTSDWQTGCRRSHNEGTGRVSLLRGQKETEKQKGRDRENSE